MKRLALVSLALALPLVASAAYAGDKLVILSPHRKSIQDEFLPKFKEYYQATYKTDVDVEWLDQGGTSDDVRFLRAKFDKTPATSGVDIFWGGGTSTFLELGRDKLLAPTKLPADLAKDVPAAAAGVPLRDDAGTWYASALSSFGLFFNEKVLKLESLPEPQTWSDLGDPKYKNQITLTDPRRSGTASTMNAIVLQSAGWDKGWELLTRIAGNTKTFTHSSSDPVKAVVAGDAAVSMVIDFYAAPKVAELGKDNLGFVLPKGQTILDSDPVAVVKGAPNAKAAERFVAWVLGADAQKLLILPKGAASGPKIETLGRMAVNTKSYAETDGKRSSEFNPFKQAAYLKLDLAKAAKLQRIFNDLVGAIQVDPHADLKAAWDAVVKRGTKPDEVAALAKPPVTEDELLKLADKWDDDVLRNKTINDWVEFARAKYKRLQEKAS